MFEIKKLENPKSGMKIRGEIDIYTAQTFKTAVLEEIGSDNKTFLLDLSELTYIDSTGIGMLIEIRNEATEKGSALKLYHPRENVMKLLRLTGVDQIFEIVEEETHDCL